MRFLKWNFRTLFCLNFKVLINFQTDLFQTGLFLKLESMTDLFLNLSNLCLVLPRAPFSLVEFFILIYLYCFLRTMLLLHVIHYSYTTQYEIVCRSNVRVTICMKYFETVSCVLLRDSTTCIYRYLRSSRTLYGAYYYEILYYQFYLPVLTQFSHRTVVIIN